MVYKKKNIGPKGSKGLTGLKTFLKKAHWGSGYRGSPKIVETHYWGLNCLGLTAHMSLIKTIGVKKKKNLLITSCMKRRDPSKNGVKKKRHCKFSKGKTMIWRKGIIYISKSSQLDLDIFKAADRQAGSIGLSDWLTFTFYSLLLVELRFMKTSYSRF